MAERTRIAACYLEANMRAMVCTTIVVDTSGVRA
jgi:hypothetical protein